MIFPCRISSVTTRLTLSTGIAKPIPANSPEGLTIAELTPINRPELSKRGPPELPGLMGALIWIMLLIVRPESPPISRPAR